MLLNKLDVYNNRLVFIGGRPQMGKTAFAISLIGECIREEERVVLFSLELDKTSILRRLRQANIPYDEELLVIDDKSFYSEDILISGVCVCPPPTLIIIDYLQMLGVDSRITELRKLGDKTGALILILSQLNQEIEFRDDMHPVLADVNSDPYDDVWFIYRDAYYDKNANDEATELIVAKSACVPVKRIPIRYDFMKNIFTEV